MLALARKVLHIITMWMSMTPSTRYPNPFYVDWPQCPSFTWLALRGDHLSSLHNIALCGVDIQAFAVPHEYESLPCVNLTSQEAALAGD